MKTQHLLKTRLLVLLLFAFAFTKAQVVITTTITPACNHDGAVAISYTGGSGGIPVHWLHFLNMHTYFNQPSLTYSGLEGGDYVFTMQTDSTTFDSLYFTIPSVISAQASVIDASCNNNGSISTTVSGGTAPYTYLWSNGASTSSISNLSSGLYHATIHDANGCVAHLHETVSNLSPLKIYFTQSGNSCTSIITAFPSGGNSPYTYLWGTGETTNYVSTQLGSGFEYVTITDASGCMLSGHHYIDSSKNFIDSLGQTIVQPGCTGNDGSISLTNLVGTAPFSFQWSNGATTASIANLIVGNYAVTATDANSCISRGEFYLNGSGIQYVQPTIMNPSCGTSNGAITLSPYGGVAPYTYQWSNNISSGSYAQNLSTGHYTYTVTDANGCLFMGNVYLKCPFIITPTITPECNNDGAVIFNYTGGSGNATYSLFRGVTAYPQQTSPIFTGLVAGAYYLILSTATDSADISFTIPSVIKLQSTVTPISCSNTGNITVSVTGGTPGYNYQWSNGATTQNINTHTPGFYYLTVTDANQCSTTLMDSVGQNLFSTYISYIGLPTCGAADGAITVSSSLGLAPYTYQWTNNVSNSASATNLSVGNYSVTATDANGCSTTNSANLFSNIQITPTVTAECTPGSGALTCNLACSNSGVHHYTLYNNLTGSITRQSSPTFPNLTSGSYTLGVGGVDSGFVAVNIPSSISVHSSPTNFQCPNTGSIVITPTSGQAPYSYIWSNGATTASISNLSQGGIYSFTVEDANGCQAIGIDSVMEISSFSPNITNIGSVCQPIFSSTPTGGTAPYTFLWSNGSTASSIPNLISGTNYFLTVTDANGCHGFEYKFNAIDSTKNWIIDSVLIQPVSNCNGSLGSISITKLLGQAPHTFLWSNGQTTPSINNLQGGYYTVTVTDAGGCSGKMTFYVSYSGNYVSGGFDTVLHTTCGGNTGKIHLSPYGGMAPYTYQWTNSSSTTNTAENLTPGGYSVTITDAAGCSAVYVTTINGIATFNEQITTTHNDCDLSIHNGTATVNVSGGGTPPFSYEWYSVNTYIGNTQTVTNLAAYKWVFVKVRDAQGCIAHDSVATFTMPDTSCGGICHAHFSIQPDPNTAHNWIVDNTSSSAHVLNYFWYWGDGSSSAGVSPSHTYSTPGYFNICLHVSDSTGCVDSYCDSSTYVFKTDEIITVNVVDKTAISTFIEKPTAEKQFMVFPNPSNGIFNIQLPVEVDNKDVNLNVTNLLGEVVFSQKMTQQNTTLDITQQPKGIYIVSFQGIDGLINKKLIKE